MEAEKIRKVLFSEVGVAVAIVSAAFWVLNYFISPVNQIKTDIAVMQRDIAVITQEHVSYSQNAADRDKAIVEIGNRLTRIEQKLDDLKK